MIPSDHWEFWTSADTWPGTQFDSFETSKLVKHNFFWEANEDAGNEPVSIRHPVF